MLDNAPAKSFMWARGSKRLHLEVVKGNVKDRTHMALFVDPFHLSSLLTLH